MLMYKMKAWGDKMTKKNEKIINGMLSRIIKEQFRKGCIIDNRFVLTDGYIFLVSDEVPNIPLYNEPDDVLNFKCLLQVQANMMRSRKIDVSYSSSAIREWHKQNGRTPYYIGAKAKGYSIGVDPLFLSEAMELTKSKTIYVADKYSGSLMLKGNGVTIFIMPILVQSDTAEETTIKEV